MPDSVSRLGPIERAIESRDAEALFAEIKRRCVVDPETGCWEWAGALTPHSYPTVGRSPRVQYVHRLTVWAASEFRGEMSDLEHVHHLCSNRPCVRPGAGHAVEVTALFNVLDAKLRKAIRTRFQAYEEVRSSPWEWCNC